MTREEAIAILKSLYPSHVGVINDNTFKVAKALRMAIEALSADAEEKVLHKILEKGMIEIPLVRCKDCKHWYADADTGMACEFTNMGQPEDGYCNWGKREGGDEK